MELFHILIIPLVLIFISFLLQEAMVKDDFFQFFKLFFMGIVSGLAINFVISSIDRLYETRANFMTILIKSSLFDGLLFAILLIVSFYIVIEYFSDITVTLDWSSCTVFAFSYFCGVYTTKHLFEILRGELPHSMTLYLSLFCFLFFIAMIVGFALPKFKEASDNIGKALWAAPTLLLSAAAFSAYSFLTFYGYAWHLAAIGAFAVLFVVFFIVDFKSYLI